MKRILLFLMLSGLFVGCTNDDSNSSETTFNMIKVSGGFAGVNETFNKGEITWILNADNATLFVVKNTNEPFTGLDEGVYNYTIETISDKQYIIINQEEFGGLTNANKGMIINQNDQSGGQGADGFLFEFQRD